MKISIVVPVYHSNELLADFTRQTLESINTETHFIDLFLIVNYSLPQFYPKKEDYKLNSYISNVYIADNPKGNQVSSAWNEGIRQALAKGNQYVIVANNDIVFHHKAIDNLVQFAVDHPEFLMWTASEWIDIRTLNGVKEADLENSFDTHPHFSCFMVNGKTISSLKEKEEGTKEPYPGYFDEDFQVGYFEDQDMAHRIARISKEASKSNLSKFYHYGSRTIKTDDRIFDLNKKTYEFNRDYFRKKWGYDPHSYCPKNDKERLAKGYKNVFNQ